MKDFTLKQIAEAVGGKLAGSDRKIAAVRTDSREAEAGDVFFALIGEANDAHAFIPGALSNGCRAFVVSNEEAMLAAMKAAGLSGADVSYVLVKDTVDALCAAARDYLKLFPGLKIVGVTGSTGKTSTRDMIYYVLSERYRTARSLKNYNNEIGLPLTVFSMPEDTEVAVLEMGMDRLGEIAHLVETAPPDVAVITNVGVTHIEKLGSRENIFKAKMEITSRFGPANTLVIFNDDDMLTPTTAAGNYRLVSVGKCGRSEYILSDVEDKGEDGVDFTVEHGEKTVRFHLNVPGRHNAANAACALAVAAQLGVTAEEGKAGLEKMKLTEKRLNIRGGNGIKVIDDCYNSSPASAKAALDVLMNTKGIRKVAVLGDMGELGVNSPQFHREVGEYAAKKGVDFLATVGPKSADTAKAAAEAGMAEDTVMAFATKEDFIARKAELIRPGDVVLVKGSRSMAMEKIVKELI